MILRAAQRIERRALDPIEIEGTGSSRKSGARPGRPLSARGADLTPSLRAPDQVRLQPRPREVKPEPATPISAARADRLRPDFTAEMHRCQEACGSVKSLSGRPGESVLLVAGNNLPDWGKETARPPHLRSSARVVNI